MSAQHRGAARAGLCPSYFGFGSTAAWGLFAEADQVQAIFERYRKRSIKDGTIHRKVRLWWWWRWWSSSLLLENSSINLRWGGWAEWGHGARGRGSVFKLENCAVTLLTYDTAPPAATIHCRIQPGEWNQPRIIHFVLWFSWRYAREQLKPKLMFDCMVLSIRGLTSSNMIWIFG